MTTTTPPDLSAHLAHVLTLTPTLCEVAVDLAGNVPYDEIARRLNVDPALILGWIEHHFGLRSRVLLLETVEHRRSCGLYVAAASRQLEFVIDALDQLADGELVSDDPVTARLPTVPALPPQTVTPSAGDLLDAEVGREYKRQLRDFNDPHDVADRDLYAPPPSRAQVFAQVVTDHSTQLTALEEATQ